MHRSMHGAIRPGWEMFHSECSTFITAWKIVSASVLGARQHSR